jgi:hypothetical protein
MVDERVTAFTEGPIGELHCSPSMRREIAER